MNSVPIHFAFESMDAAVLAQETMQELGYQTELQKESGEPVLHAFVIGSDLASALEIGQSLGARFIEHTPGLPSESAAISSAYELGDTIPIPAHIVNEDWAESYSSFERREEADGRLEFAPGAGTADHSGEEEPFDPSGRSYDGFDAGLHI